MKNINIIIKKYKLEDFFKSCDTFTDLLFNLLWIKNNIKLKQKDKEIINEFLLKNNII